MKVTAQDLPDATARHEAATDFEHNLLVLAGAGTGKTSLLVERFLNAIGSGRADIKEIAAITFTDKAAAEMRERVAAGLEELRALSRGERPVTASPASRSHQYLSVEQRTAAATIADRALRALESLDAARVMTIHSFCSELLRAHPFEAHVDPRFDVDTGERARALVDVAWEEFIARELGPAAQRPALWTGLLGELKLKELGKTARALADFKIPVEVLRTPYRPPTAQQLLAQPARSIADEIAALLAGPDTLSPVPQHYFRSMERALRTLADEGLLRFKQQVQGNVALLTKLDEGKSLSFGKKLDAGFVRKAKSLFKRSRTLAALLLGIDEELAGRVLEALGPFTIGFRERLLQQGWVSFDGLLALARDLLRDFPEVRRDLKRRYKLILVDEFQDIDPAQYEIVLFLAEADREAAHDAFSAPLAPGKLFVVGDPKQSIYRFRGADYSTFRLAAERIKQQGGHKLDLVCNFRSVPGITGAVNRLFAPEQTACWSESPYQPRFDPIEPARQQPDLSPRVELWSVDPGQPATMRERRQAEGRLIADAVTRMVEIERTSRYEEITILFRAFASIPYYVRPLRERGIPFVIDGGKDFLKRPEVTQYLAVLRALAQPADPTALLAFLRSPAGGVSDIELADYAASGGRWDWRSEPDSERFALIASRFALLRRLRDEMRKLPVDVLIHRVMAETQMLALAAGAYEGAQRVANLQKLAAAAGKLARDGKLSFEEVVRSLQEGGLADLEADSSLADDRAEAVRITSIHKFKGLESNWIFLPDLARKDRKGWSKDVEIVQLAGREPALALKLSQGHTTAAWALLQLELQRHEEAEETRVLYVALTRARERLVLMASEPKSTSRWIKALAAWGYDGQQSVDQEQLCDGMVLHRRLVPQPAEVTISTESSAREEAAVREYAAAVERLRQSAVRPFASPSALEEAEEIQRRAEADDGVPRASSRSRDLGKAVGIAVHRLLESWDGRNTAGLHQRASWISQDLADEEGVDARALEREVREILAAFLKSNLGVIFQRVAKLGREVPLLLRKEDGRTWRGSIDLVYRDESGQIVVADYKTDHGLSSSEMQERYGFQLGIYADAVAGAMGLATRPRAELWLLRTGERLEVA